MARQPAPRIDPRDPALRPVKDFLDWLYKTVPGIPETVAALDATVAQLVTEVTAALATLATAIATVAGDLAALEVATEPRLGFLYTFYHPGQNATAATRMMYTGVEVTGSSTALEWSSRYPIPANGKMISLTVHNPVAVAGGSNTITYTMWRSTDNGNTWGATSMAVALLASSTTVTTYTPGTPFSVNAGDLIGMEITFSGAVTSNATNKSCVAAILFRGD